MAGLGKKTFAAGEVLTASNVNGYLMDQSVMAFADSTARAAAVTVPTDGMVSYLQDTNTVEQYRTFTNTGGTVVGAWEALSSGRGNAIINGDFAINQRAFTSTTTSGAYGFDRWRVDMAGGTTTYSAQTFTPGTAPVTGYEAQNFARIVTTGQSAASDYTQFNQFIEDARTCAGQTMTVSFWAKAASGTPKVSLEAGQNFGSGGSPSASTTTYGGQVTLSTSWQRYAITMAVPSIAGKTFGTTANTSLLAITFWVSAGTTFAVRTGSMGIQSNTFDFWGVQVEAGAVVSPFRTATGTKQGELAACQRYYYRITAEQPYSPLASGLTTATNLMRVFVYFPVKMRTIPNAFDWTGTPSNYTWYGTGTSPGTITSGISALSSSACEINIPVTGATVNAPCTVVAAGNTVAYFGFGAEL